jgi:hypothetical protein
MSGDEEAAWLAANGAVAVDVPGARRCPRCNGLLFGVDDPDYALCLTHGEQFIGVVPDDVDLDRRKDPTRVRRTLGDVDASAERDAARRRQANRRYWQRKRERKPGPAPRPDAAERRAAKQKGYILAYRARLSAEQAAQAAQRAAYKRERRAAAK